MPAVQRDGDLDNGGGIAQGGVGTVRVNGKAIMVAGQPVTAHPKKHSGQTTGGSSTVKAGGLPVIRTNDVDSCGHIRVGGSPDVRAG